MMEEVVQWCLREGTVGRLQWVWSNANAQYLDSSMHSEHIWTRGLSSDSSRT